MKNPFRKDRKSKLQDRDVREIAKMQMRIDYYEQCMLQLWELANGKEPGLALLREDDLDFPIISQLFRYIEKTKDKPKKRESGIVKRYENIFLGWHMAITGNGQAEYIPETDGLPFKHSIDIIDEFINKNIK